MTTQKESPIRQDGASINAHAHCTGISPENSKALIVRLARFQCITPDIAKRILEERGLVHE
jgi:hypothetical protein